MTARLTREQLAGVVRGLEFAADYCGRTQAFDSQRHIREGSAALVMLTREREELERAAEAVWQWRMKGTRGDAMPEAIADIVRAVIRRVKP